MPPRRGWSSQRGIINVRLGLPVALARPLGPSHLTSGLDDGPGNSCISNAGNLPGGRFRGGQSREISQVSRGFAASILQRPRTGNQECKGQSRSNIPARQSLCDEMYGVTHRRRFESHGASRRNATHMCPTRCFEVAATCINGVNRTTSKPHTGLPGGDHGFDRHASSSGMQ